MLFYSPDELCSEPQLFRGTPSHIIRSTMFTLFKCLPIRQYLTKKTKNSRIFNILVGTNSFKRKKCRRLTRRRHVMSHKSIRFYLPPPLHAHTTHHTNTRAR